MAKADFQLYRAFGGDDAQILGGHIPVFNISHNNERVKIYLTLPLSVIVGLHFTGTTSMSGTSTARTETPVHTLCELYIAVSLQKTDGGLLHVCRNHA